jgi:hypothetical protein
MGTMLSPRVAKVRVPETEVRRVITQERARRLRRCLQIRPKLVGLERVIERREGPSLRQHPVIQVRACAVDVADEASIHVEDVLRPPNPGRHLDRDAGGSVGFVLEEGRQMHRGRLAPVLPKPLAVKLRAIDALPADGDPSMSEDGLSSECGTLEGSSGAPFELEALNVDVGRVAIGRAIRPELI